MKIQLSLFKKNVVLWAMCLLLAGFVMVPVSRAEDTSSTKKKAQKAPVMLAKEWKSGQAVDGWWVSEKLDGVRAYWTGSELISRGGKVFKAPSWFIENFPTEPLDGELWVGRGKFAETTSIVRKKDAGDLWKQVHYMVFDAPKHEGPFEARMAFVSQWFEKNPNAYVRAIEQEVVQSEADLLKRLKAVEAKEGEGLMLRKPESSYTVGRSSDLLKVKTQYDMEATVVKHIPGSGRNEGRLGSLLVELPNGIQFAIGTGFSDKDRRNPPPVGSTITFKYRGWNASGKPRFPSFMRTRSDNYSGGVSQR